MTDETNEPMPLLDAVFASFKPPLDVGVEEAYRQEISSGQRVCLTMTPSQQSPQLEGAASGDFASSETSDSSVSSAESTCQVIPLPQKPSA